MKLAVVVEGPTEERFVKDVLGPYLIERGVNAVPILVGINRRKKGGGDVNVDDLVMDLCDALDQYGAATSLVDFYGFRGRGGQTPEELEGLVSRGVMEGRDAGLPMRPYVQVHEFEGLLFSDPEAFQIIRRYSHNDVGTIIERLLGIRDAFDTPEDINDSPDSAPSKRLERELGGYRKIADGIAVAQQIGIEKISEECPRFRAWLNWMEGIAEDCALN